MFDAPKNARSSCMRQKAAKLTIQSIRTSRSIPQQNLAYGVLLQDYLWQEYARRVPKLRRMKRVEGTDDLLRWYKRQHAEDSDSFSEDSENDDSENSADEIDDEQ